MKTRLTYLSLKALCAASVATVLTAVSLQASVVVWELNPANTNGAVGSSSHTFTSQGYQITGLGYDNNNGTGTAHELFYKSQGPIGGGSEHGLGLTNVLDNELGLTAQGAVANFIQLDLSSILLQGFTNGKIEVGSIQPGESFQLFGSNTKGLLGTSLGAAFGSNVDDQFVSVPDFGMYKYLSVAAASADVLPVAFEAQITPVPEMNALFPILGLATAVGSTHVLRRRRVKALSSAETNS